MTLVVKDRVQETSTTTGTGTYTLAGAVTGYQAFSVIGDANQTYYTATDGTDWEVGIGTYTSAGTTLSRDAILESSNAGAAVNWGAGTRTVFVTWPADAANLNWSTTATAGGTTTLTNQSSYFQFFTGTNTQTVQLPVVSTIAQGWTYHITNNSTGNLTVNSSGGNLVITVIPGTTVMVTCILITGTTAASWEAGYTDFSTITGTGGAVLATSPTVTNLSLAAGTTALAPLDFVAGTNLTTPVAGAMEYDGVVPYFTNDTTSGRGYLPTIQIFRLTANGANIGSGIANFFGNNSAINLVGGGAYEIEAYCYFTKNTAGTVTVTITSSLAPVNLNGVLQTGAVAGGTASGTATQIAIFNSTATGAAFGATGSLTNNTNHVFQIRLIVEANASASNLRINFTESAGTVTPLRGSYYKVTRLPAGNTGSFAA